MLAIHEGKTGMHPSRKANYVFDFAFSADGVYLASAGGGGAKLWDTATGRLVHELKPSNARYAYRVDFSHDGKMLAAAHDLGATIWDVSSGEELHFFAAERRRQWFSSAYFSPDDSQLVTTGRLPRILLWDLQTGGNTPATRRIQTGRTVVFSPDGRQFAVSGRPTIYDVASGERRMEFLGHRGGVNTVSFNRDGTRLVTAGDDGTVRIWHTATGRELLTLEGHQGKVYSASFSPDGSGLVSSSADGTIRIWKAAKQDM